MDKELFAKLYTDESFKIFCSQIDQLRKQEYKISLPLETTTLLLGSGIGYLKEDIHISSQTVDKLVLKLMLRTMFVSFCFPKLTITGYIIK